MKGNRQKSTFGFAWGVAIGAILALAASLSTGSLVNDDPAQWLTTNLGHSIWFFAAVTLLFGMNLFKLNELLEQTHPPLEESKTVIGLDQLLDVWIQVFIGIGVIWTAVGMRSALQFTLADPGSVLTDDAGNVLRKLVDGGILLALSTTILGAAGGYLMRLIKTIVVGSGLQIFYDQLDRRDSSALLKAVERIERRLGSLEQDHEVVTPLSGHQS